MNTIRPRRLRSDRTARTRIVALALALGVTYGLILARIAGVL